MTIKFCSGAYFFRLEPDISNSGSRPEDLGSEFLRPEKIHRPQPGLNPRTLDFEASTLPRDHRGRLGIPLPSVGCYAIELLYYITKIKIVF